MPHILILVGFIIAAMAPGEDSTDYLLFEKKIEREFSFSTSFRFSEEGPNILVAISPSESNPDTPAGELMRLNFREGSNLLIDKFKGGTRPLKHKLLRNGTRTLTLGLVEGDTPSTSPLGKEIFRLKNANTGQLVFKRENNEIIDDGTGFTIGPLPFQQVLISNNHNRVLIRQALKHFFVDAGSGTVLREFSIEQNSPNLYSGFRHNDTILALNYKNRHSELWNGKTGATVKSFSQGDIHRGGIAVSPDGRHVITKKEGENFAALQKVETGEAVIQIPHTSHLWYAMFSPDGKRAMTAGKDSFTKLVNVETGEIIREIEHANHISGIAFSDDGSRAMSVSATDNKVYLFNADTGEDIAVVSHENTLSAAHFAAKGKRLVTRSGGTLKITNTQNGSLVASLTLSGGRTSSSGKLLVHLAGNRGKLFDMMTGEVVREFVFEGSASANHALKNGERAVFASGGDSKFYLFDSKENQTLFEGDLGEQRPTQIQHVFDDRAFWICTKTQARLYSSRKIDEAGFIELLKDYDSDQETGEAADAKRRGRQFLMLMHLKKLKSSDFNRAHVISLMNTHIETDLFRGVGINSGGDRHILGVIDEVFPE